MGDIEEANLTEWLYIPGIEPAKELSKHDQRMIKLGWDAASRLLEPKPDESRLLTPQEHSLAIIDYMRKHGGVTESDKLTKTEVFEITCRAQRDLTASTKDAEKAQCLMCIRDLKRQLREQEAECRLRVEEIRE